ncbi:isochorismate synthase [Arcanobacterium ihumii]|uniref:isochorismate synthase n=1 Tax=Arcanobacterium ihumii TaxID=2138162 RepID=UPI000F52D833|nr:chorismate-binding protein [Arcanobacterium ihumii]
MLTIPHLRSQTSALPFLPKLEDLFTSPRQQLAWIHGEDGFVAAGTAARKDYTPASSDSSTARFEALTQWWQALEDDAEVRDEVRTIGTGLLAFGSFSFAPHSPAGSSLIVPQVLVGRRQGKAWLTIIGPIDDDVFNTLAPEAQALLDAVLKREHQEYGEFTVDSVEEIPDVLEWQAQVERASQTIRAGEADKIVLSRTLALHTSTQIDERQILSRLHQKYPSTWIFAIDGLIGASPEMLAASAAIIDDSPLSGTEGNKVFARVLAGTLPIQQNSDPATGSSLSHNAYSHAELDEKSRLLTASEKDQLEHQVAVESVVSTLTKVGKVETSGTFVLTLPNVLHLATDVVADLFDSSSIIDIAGLLHPTAALGGSPKDAVLEIIDTIEVTDRDRYGAPVGWISSGNFGQWCVALRCARIDSNNTARAWAGGGIMGDSVPSIELAETEAKFEPVMDAFQITDFYDSTRK